MTTTHPPIINPVLDDGGGGVCLERVLLFAFLAVADPGATIAPASVDSSSGESSLAMVLEPVNRFEIFLGRLKYHAAPAPTAKAPPAP